MPDLFDVIRERRSIRKYQPQAVEKELVEKVLAAAGLAPSAHNAQPYRFIILENPKVKRELADAMAQAWAADLESDGLTVSAENRKERADRFVNAPVLILACTTEIEGMPRYADMRRRGCVRDLAVQSLGAALQNLFLAAHAVGLGGCWYAAPCFCKAVVQSHLNIPEEVEPQTFVTLGYAAETPPARTKKTLTEYCFRDLWGKPI
ncbi:MAG: nitroreductase family protein [Candidatus Bathyarchaeota archaeon]|nr:nitroreductase family protein [Candidatus Bathyarchaeota archaeon]